MPRKNLRKIPPNVRAKITGFDVDDVIVACVKRISRNELGNYAHLDLRLQNGRFVPPPPSVPAETLGRYCSINVSGQEIVRRDLPMTTKTFSVEAPNWRGYGTHDVYWTREVYQRDFIPPEGAHGLCRTPCRGCDDDHGKVCC